MTLYSTRAVYKLKLTPLYKNLLVSETKTVTPSVVKLYLFTQKGIQQVYHVSIP